MFKKFIPVLVVSAVMACSVIAYAAPAAVAPSDTGNTTGLIELKNPATDTSTTTQNNFVISGVGLEGVLTGLYEQKIDGEDYRIMVIDGELAQQIIGSSGLFAQRVYLIQGKNTLIIRAETTYGQYEIKRFEINLLNDNFWERLKKIPFNLQQGLSTMFR